MTAALRRHPPETNLVDRDSSSGWPSDGDRLTIGGHQSASLLWGSNITASLNKMKCKAFRPIYSRPFIE